MASIRSSKIMAWGSLVIIIAWMVVTVTQEVPWWGYIDVFMGFMAVFCHLASIYLLRISPAASKRLDTIAMVFIILTLVAFIAEYVLSSAVFKL